MSTLKLLKSGMSTLLPRQVVNLKQPSFSTFRSSYHWRRISTSTPSITHVTSEHPSEPQPETLPTAVQPVLWPVPTSEDGSRLDRFVKRRAPGVPPGLIQRLIRQRRVYINSEPANRNAFPVYTGDVVRFPGEIKLGLNRGKRKPADTDVSLAEAEEVRSWILHRDARCAVLNKPAGLSVQRGGGRCLEDLLCGLGAGRYWLVHRLDREVSGAIVVARDVGAAGLLAEAFRSREVVKKYWGLVAGKVKEKRGVIDRDVDGRKAVTRWRVVEPVDRYYTWLELEPRTGRKHQLRVHCADVLGTPLVGDLKYGGTGEGGDLDAGLHLMSREICFPRLTATSGGGGKRRRTKRGTGIVSVTAPLPPHMKDTWKRLGLDEQLA